MVFLLGQAASSGQVDTVLQLPQVDVSATSLRRSPPGDFSQTFDSTTLQKNNTANLSDLLHGQGIFIKSYGLGSLATSSVRGGSAGQTAVLWNGFQIQSPMLGLLDLSLLPVSFADEISLRYGGNSSLWGSGAVGGVVSLENQPDFEKKISLRAESAAGSFGWFSEQLKLKLAGNRFASATRLFYLTAENDFPFRTASGQPERRQANAAQKQGGGMQEIYWRPSARQEFSLQTWLQTASREIPPTTTQAHSEADQSDEVWRTALHWKLAGSRWMLQARTAFFRETIRYRDEPTGIDARTRFWTSISEAEFQRQLGKAMSVQVGVNQTITRAFSKNYASLPVRNQSALFASWRIRQGAWSAQFNGRTEWVDGEVVPFTPSLGVERTLRNWLKISGKVSKSYRLPTLNDLHWQPGGQPDLLPENGWGEEVGAVFSFKKKHQAGSFTASVFNRHIKNWILWHPADGQPWWSASNIAEVWSRGIEQRFGWSWQRGFWQVKLNGGYDFIRSTNEKPLAVPKVEAGGQLIYVPEHQAFAQASVQFRDAEISYLHHFTGSVGTELGSLPAYQTGTLRLDYEAPFRHWQPRFFLTVENLWDETYRVIERRPMPGRYFRAGVSASFSKN
ncbi:MAG: TonB-dependent receptor [Bacteroidetes bacterium]|nr:TonB-dependent receptor [Bacteroidota bacterium]